MADKLLGLVYGDGTLGVHGEDFHFLFSYQTGGLESLVYDDMEWLYRTPKPTFWRALTDNDRGSRFHLKSGMWLSADMFQNCVGIRVWIDGAEIELPVAPINNRYTGNETAMELTICFSYETITNPVTTVDVTYRVTCDGEIRISVHYHGKVGLPELPVFGMRFLMPTAAEGYRYAGLSGETYPDRMAGGICGMYEIEGLPVTPYLVPQDCGVHMQTEWLEVYRKSSLDNSRREQVRGGLRFWAERPFAFSCLPYTAEELENATHQEELPPARRTVVCILGAVRGIGGIDSWGAEVEPEYRISGERDICYEFGVGRCAEDNAEKMER